MWATGILSFSMPILDVNEIRQIMPHRYPFLLVDRIIELEAERIVGI
jgi:3-hydroxymyristoyl/3-hydroxydecanoyl-(acyl carrier protein) dehydratase